MTAAPELTTATAAPQITGVLDGLAERLLALHDTRYDLFHRAFALGLPTELGSLEDALTEIGLGDRTPDGLLCRFRLTRLGDDLLATDVPEYPGRDRVLYLSDNESLLRARTLPDCTGLRVLDLGAGSGVQAIAAHRRGAAAVTSVDINPRAVALTRFNLALNGLPHHDVRLSSLADFQPEQGRYDVLVNNPPFVPVPPDTRFMTSGAGGIDGLDFVRQLIARLPDLLQPRGTLCLVSLSPGSRHLSELESLLLDHAGDRALELTATRIFEQPSPIGDSLEPFADRADTAAWAAELAARGYTHMHNLLLTLAPAARPAFRRGVLESTLELHPGNKGSTGWAALYAEIRLALEMAQ